MKKLIIIAMALFTLIAMSATSWAAEEEILGTVKSVTIKPNSNGEEFVRIIVNMQRSISGTAYVIGVPVIAHQGTATPEAFETAKTLQAGNTVKLIGQKRMYEGRDYYNLIKFASEAPKTAATE